jgi:hypothetical protein
MDRTTTLKITKKRNRTIIVELIQWSNSFPEDVIWEGLEKNKMQNFLMGRVLLKLQMKKQ